MVERLVEYEALARDIERVQVAVLERILEHEAAHDVHAARLVERDAVRGDRDEVLRARALQAALVLQHRARALEEARVEVARRARDRREHRGEVVRADLRVEEVPVVHEAVDRGRHPVLVVVAHAREREVAPAERDGHARGAAWLRRRPSSLNLQCFRIICLQISNVCLVSFKFGPDSILARRDD